MDIRVRVSGGGHTSQIYAIRQAIAKACVAYWAKYYDAAHALSLKKSLVDYDRTLLIADPRRMEPKKFGGGGARARRQKRYGIYSFEMHRDCQCSNAVLVPVTDRRFVLLPRLVYYVCRYAIWRSICFTGKNYASFRNHLRSRFVLRNSYWGDGIPLKIRYLFFLGIGVLYYAGHQ